MLNPNKILSDYQLRKTNCRVAVLNIFIQNQHIGLSETYLEHHTDGAFDRATIYRTLNTFQEKGVIHRILDEDNVVKYALCIDTCSPDHHHHEHIHFKCTTCNTTTCLDEVSAVEIQLPGGYTKKEANYLIVGVCNKCNAA